MRPFQRHPRHSVVVVSIGRGKNHLTPPLRSDPILNFRLTRSLGSHEYSNHSAVGIRSRLGWGSASPRSANRPADRTRSAVTRAELRTLPPASRNQYPATVTMILRQTSSSFLLMAFPSGYMGTSYVSPGESDLTNAS